MSYTISETFEYKCEKEYTYNTGVLTDTTEICTPSDELQSTSIVILLFIVLYIVTAFIRFLVDIMKPNIAL
jgi:hypothetical protein